MTELADLVGTHVLDAVDFSQEHVGSAGYIEDAESMRFRLDGVVYVAVEDPNDGYRSCLDKIFVGEGPMHNEFQPHKVVCNMRDTHGEDILDIVDATTGKIVISVGTDGTDDYYPGFVSIFNPENLAANAKGAA